MHRHEQLVSEVNEIVKQQRLKGQIETLEWMKEWAARMYERANHYTNLVILGGYAGMFGLWQLTKQYLPILEIKIIGISLCLSVLLFASHEVYKMIVAGILLKNVKRLIKQNVQPENFQGVWEGVITDYDLRMSNVWLWFLIPTLITGLGAGLLLLGTLVFSLI